MGRDCPYWSIRNIHLLLAKFFSKTFFQVYFPSLAAFFEAAFFRKTWPNLGKRNLCLNRKMVSGKNPWKNSVSLQSLGKQKWIVKQNLGPSHGLGLGKSLGKNSGGFSAQTFFQVQDLDLEKVLVQVQDFCFLLVPLVYFSLLCHSCVVVPTVNTHK
jgi:hypothetical protein